MEILATIFEVAIDILVTYLFVHPQGAFLPALFCRPDSVIMYKHKVFSLQ